MGGGGYTLFKENQVQSEKFGHFEVRTVDEDIYPSSIPASLIQTMLAGVNELRLTQRRYFPHQV